MSLLDQLVTNIADRAGIPVEKAQAAAQAAIQFLDTRLPPPVGGNLKNLVEGGEGGAGGPLGGLAGKLGGMLGQ